MTMTALEQDKASARAACCPGLSLTCGILALLAAVTALAGSLYLSMGLGLQACPLCIYERTFLMGVVTVLGLGWLVPGVRASGAIYGLALPLAVAGLGVAAFHVRLEMVQTLVCPGGLWSAGTAPQQSLAAYVIVTVLLVGAILGRSSFLAWPSLGQVGLGFGLGAVFSIAAIVSGPKLPPPAQTLTELQSLAANQELDGCKPVKY